MPADWRYNPYTGVMESVDIVDEIHVIPSNAPYYIRLSEVPEKTSPSTLSIKFENNTALTEVSANPEPTQFWPDYSTSDEEINSGLIMFNVADAGKVIKASYKGVGTLASIKSECYPSWWFERGDGRLGNKICVNGEIFEGVYNFNNLTIPSGVTIYISKTARLLCKNHLINEGTISGVGRGADGGSLASSQGSPGAFAGGGGAGGKGGGSSGTGGGVAGIGSYKNYFMEMYTGSASAALVDKVVQYITDSIYGAGGTGGGAASGGGGGGGGGNGGAGIVIVASTVINKGTISAKGGNGVHIGNSSGGGGGGGGGGAVIIVADSIYNSGTIDSSGGNGAGMGSNGAAGFSGWQRLIELGAL